jgi:hypothetical protein
VRFSECSHVLNPFRCHFDYCCDRVMSKGEKIYFKPI